MTYLYRVMKKGQPELGATTEGLETLNTILLDFYDELAKETARISKMSNSQTIKGTDVQTAAKLFLP